MSQTTLRKALNRWYLADLHRHLAATHAAYWRGLDLVIGSAQGVGDALPYYVLLDDQGVRARVTLDTETLLGLYGPEDTWLYLLHRTILAVVSSFDVPRELALVPWTPPPAERDERIEDEDTGWRCLDCDLPMARNPHPDAGKPARLSEVGAVWQCVPCTVGGRHKAIVRASRAEADLQRLLEPDPTAPGSALGVDPEEVLQDFELLRVELAMPGADFADFPRNQREALRWSLSGAAPNLAREVIRLRRCLHVAGLQAFIRSPAPEEVTTPREGGGA